MRFGDFFSRMWLDIALRARTFPFEVSLKRFFAPECVFILGIANREYRNSARPRLSGSPVWRRSAVGLSGVGSLAGRVCCDFDYLFGGLSGNLAIGLDGDVIGDDLFGYYSFGDLDFGLFTRRRRRCRD